jgi:parvulin-like peptidyl-prolyl cis-trans isomerase-like protein/SurA-like protein
MKHKVLIGSILVATFIGANAQVASHTSAAATQAAPKTPSPQSTVLQVSDKPVARVNGVVLTDRDLLREMYAIFPYAQQHNGGFPKAQEPAIRQGALEMIIFEELVYQDAVRNKVTIPPQQVKAAEAEFQRQFGTPDKYQEFLKTEMQGNPDLVRQKIRRSLMIEQELKTKVGDKSVVSLAEARDYYNKHPQRFQQPESFSIQTISILPPPGTDPSKLTPQQKSEIRKRADAALRQVKATMSYQEFGLLAEKISEDDYRVNMGLHKTAVKPEELPPDLLKVLATMQPGSVSGLIPVQGAYTIIRLNAHTLAHKLSFEQVKKPLQEELQKEKYEKLRSNLGKQLRANAKIEVV